MYKYIFFCIVFKIQTLKSGQEIMEDFFSMVVPRIRNKNLFGGAGLRVGLKIVCFSRLAKIVIYHSVRKRTIAGIYQTIQRLTDQQVLARNVVRDTLHEFNLTAMIENCDFFCASVNDFKDFKALAYVPLLMQKN